MADKADIKRYISNLQDEFNSKTVYKAIADSEKDRNLADIYNKLAETEDAHSKVWINKLAEAGVAPPKLKPTLRTRILIWFAMKKGADTVLPSLVAAEDAGASGYSQHPDSLGMVTDEQSHARMLRQMSKPGVKGMQGGDVAKMEGRHKAGGGNALRAAVLGASDGLISNFNLVMGVAGAELATRTILLTGIAGLLAGAISMALGEWISVQSSRELYQKQIATEEEEIAASPEEEIEELSLIYQARGLSEESARAIAEQIMSNRESALETLAREELGINPEDLGGSAWEASFTSFLLFAIGAIIPVVPYMFLSDVTAIIVSASFSAVALFAVGAAITLFTGRSIWSSGLRQVAFGLVAAAATFGIGRLIGVSIAG